MNEKRVARIFEELDGFHVCDNAQSLDARGPAYPTKAAALRAAYDAGYWYAVGEGCDWGHGIARIPRRYRDGGSRRPQ